MELVYENLTEDQKLSYKQANSVLKKIFPGVRVLSSRFVRRFCSERSIFSTGKVTEIVRETSSKVILAF